MLRRLDLIPLYGTCAFASCFGMLAGNAAAGRIDQRTFGHVLTALMCLCCALLLASGLGLSR